MLGKNIFRVREPTLISTHQRQIAAVEAYDGRRREIVRGRQRPVNVSGQEGMVARMVVKVGNKGIEANAAEEFASIFNPPLRRCGAFPRQGGYKTISLVRRWFRQSAAR